MSTARLTGAAIKNSTLILWLVLLLLAPLAGCVSAPALLGRSAGELAAVDHPGRAVSSNKLAHVVEYRSQNPTERKTRWDQTAGNAYAIMPLPALYETGLEDVPMVELASIEVSPFEDHKGSLEQNDTTELEAEPEVVRYEPIFDEGRSEELAILSPWASGEISPGAANRSLTMAYVDLFDEQFSAIQMDFAEYYSAHNLALLASGFAAGALMANTGFDEHFLRDSYVDNIVRSPSNELYEALHEPKFLGDGTYTIPAFALLALSDPLLENLPLGPQASEWGQRSLRTILVGAPPMLAAQLLTGASRPGEASTSSHWQPFQDNNGVSGHSFMGAIPFITAAKMSDSMLLKSQFYALSVLPGLSRINDDDHYFSQVFLGWWMAYAAASAIDRTQKPDARYQWNVFPTNGGMGISFATAW